MTRKEFISIMRSKPILRIIVPPVLRFFNPNYSSCEKCGLPWNWCESKAVKHNNNKGTFATCDYCWDNSTLEELKSCYTKTYLMQKKSLAGSGYDMGHSLEHLLRCVEDEYTRTHN